MRVNSRCSKVGGMLVDMNFSHKLTSKIPITMEVTAFPRKSKSQGFIQYFFIYLLQECDHKKRRESNYLMDRLQFSLEHLNFLKELYNTAKHLHACVTIQIS
jgi:hypothetical protein